MDNKRISEIVYEEMMKQDANRYRDMRKILTIPKSIAEQADKYLRMDWEFRDIYSKTGKCSDEFYDFINCEDNNQRNSKLIIAYLAGKALGVDLVKVVEG
ncbi:hypothetical protein [Lactococcus kimchii]|uniref:hypothetical protein n=1 Tax=Lactococcus sp. S-13 TaxID=2507158 RepID=UPI0010237F24|nr:hypothetical protein [Lactococcus sp. S-13]RZI48441.1 hypothetical protein EQJ87_02675 [Lactococcus sp. S-13]